MRFSSLLSVAVGVLRWPLAAAVHVAQLPLSSDSSNNGNHDLLQSHDLSQYIEDVMKEWHAPGLAVSIVQGNDTWAKGYGYASFPSTRVTPHTLFYTGSTTKSFTAAAISLLIDNSSDYSSIKWTTPISQLLREDFVLSDEWATHHITIEDALSHRTGFARNDLAIPNETRDLVRIMRHLPMATEPRVKLHYNNFMFGTAGYLIEKLTGQSLGAFFRTYLWEPMGLNETFLGLYDPALNGSSLLVADEYYYKNSTDEYLRLDHAKFMADEGAGSVVSNVLDYAKYLRVMMNEDKPLSKDGHREIKTARSFYNLNYPPFVGPVTYTLAWMSGIFQGEQVWLHSGQVNQFTTWMLMVPSRKIGITVMTNSASKAMTLVLYRILYDLLDVNEKDRFDFAAKFKVDGEERKQYLATCSEQLYPNLPSPPLQHTVPLANYTGTFRDAGYGDYEVVLNCDNGGTNTTSSPTLDDSCHLNVRKPESSLISLEFTIKLEHKSGEYWLGWIEAWDTDQPEACIETQFRVNAQGVVTSLGMNVRLEDDVPLIWFERV